jgi:hypothetical protein
MNNFAPSNEKTFFPFQVGFDLRRFSGKKACANPFLRALRESMSLENTLGQRTKGLNEADFLERIQLFKDVMVKYLEPFGFPQLRKGALFTEVIATDFVVEILVDKRIPHDHVRPNEFVFHDL